jgi:hypothetical protein
MAIEPVQRCGSVDSRGSGQPDFALRVFVAKTLFFATIGKSGG